MAVVWIDGKSDEEKKKCNKFNATFYFVWINEKNK